MVVELLNLKAKLIDDAPSDDVLASKPDTSFVIVCFLEEQLQMQQVAEFIALEDRHFNSWHVL